MNDNFSANQFSDRREARYQRRTARRGGEWMVGIVLIVIAVVLLMGNMNMVTITNWWALFILLPAFGSFETAWRLSRETGGKFTFRAREAFIVGVLLVIVTVMFLLHFSWTILGPVLLVLAGVSLFANSLLPQ